MKSMARKSFPLLVALYLKPLGTSIECGQSFPVAVLAVCRVLRCWLVALCLSVPVPSVLVRLYDLKRSPSGRATVIRRRLKCAERWFVFLVPGVSVRAYITPFNDGRLCDGQ
ncbi:hypothetical protein F5148DRAFT_1236022 [Russula earlei]|uniref:Uncharacterized protein n=1 Tax=Russula earlei TaxID=71964 RepID=A0ACC0TX87_9AGAM|nr:hypothetical protein F5148DRAFT_1236022 [Russula earlei]